MKTKPSIVHPNGGSISIQSTSNRAPLRLATPGILDRTKSVTTLAQARKLNEEMDSYKEASSKTRNKFDRLMLQAIQRINTTEAPKAPRAKKSTTAAAA